MANEFDYIKAAKEKGLSDEAIMKRACNIKQLDKEDKHVDWKWHIDMLIKPFKE